MIDRTIRFEITWFFIQPAFWHFSWWYEPKYGNELLKS